MSKTRQKKAKRIINKLTNSSIINKEQTLIEAIIFLLNKEVETTDKQQSDFSAQMMRD